MKIEIIPEYSLEVRFSNNSIEIYDLISREVINSTNLDEQIKEVQKVSYDSFLINDRYLLGIGLVQESCKIATNAQYIIELTMDNENHGYYFGTYEIGEFILKENNILEIIKSFPLKNCSRGLVSPSKHFFVSIREGDDPDKPDKYYLVKINWEDLSYLWKKSINSPVLAIHIYGGKLYLGLRGGVLEIWNLETEELEKEIEVFETPISDFEVLNDKIILTGWSGVVKTIDRSGILLWKVKLSDYRISGLLVDEERVKVIDETGHFFEINIKNGEILKELLWDFKNQTGASTYSNLISLRNWYISFGGAGLWAHWSENHKNSYHIFMQDPLIRKVVPHPLGFFTGDDDGYIRFWKIGSISVYDLEMIRKEKDKIKISGEEERIKKKGEKLQKFPKRYRKTIKNDGERLAKLFKRYPELLLQKKSFIAKQRKEEVEVNPESVKNAVEKIEYIMKDNAVNELAIERKYLPEIFSADLLGFSQDGLPTLKPFVLKELFLKGIFTRFYGNVIKFFKKK